MSRSTILIILGLVVLVAPFSGAYGSWIAFLEAACGIAIIGIGTAERSSIVRRTRESSPHPVPEVAADAAHPSTVA